MTTRIGAVEITALLDAVGELGELGELYPETPPEAWQPYRELYPELFVDGRWRLPCTSYLIRSKGAAILVDTGVGPSGLWDWTAEREALLPSALEEHGVGRDDIDVVFLTHLHIDHIGWNTDDQGEIFFPRARYLLHRDALAFVRSHDLRPHVTRCITPLVDHFEELSGDLELASDVIAFELRGHYPGHMGLRIGSAGNEAMLIADAAVHPALLDEPGWLYVSDGDPALCAETRRALLEDVVDRDVTVVCGHYPAGGIGRVVTRDKRVVWERERPW